MTPANAFSPVAFGERRLTQRVYQAWARLATGGLPSWDVMRAVELGEDWKSCFAIDLALSDGFAYFTFIGDEALHLSRLTIAGDETRQSSVIDIVASKMDEVALSRTPLLTSEAKRLTNGKRLLFRSVLAPLSEDGQNVTHLFGAAVGKGVAAREQG